MRIYKIKNTQNSKEYIGRTTKPIQTRLKEHILESRRGSNYKIHKAIREFGEDKFVIEEIKQCASISDMIKSEVFFIKLCDTVNNGYNQTYKGGVTHHTTKSRQKMSAAQKGRPKSESFKRNLSEYWMGKKRGPFSEEHKQKLREAKLKKPTRYWLGKKRDGKGGKELKAQ